MPTASAAGASASSSGRPGSLFSVLFALGGLRLAGRIAESVHARRLRRLSHQRAPCSGSRGSTACRRARPRRAGRWLLDVTNVSVTPYTYTEDFTGNDAVLSRDNLKIAFRGPHRVAGGRRAGSALHGALQHDGHGRRARKGAGLRSSRSPTATSSASRCEPTRATRCSAATVSR